MNDLFAGVTQRPISIRGTPARSPLFFRDLAMMMAVVAVDRESAAALLPQLPGYRPLTIAPGRALLGINCFEYRDTDVGPYHEVSIAVALRPPGQRGPGPWLAGRAAFRRRYHAFIADLPVTTEIAVAGGVDFLNFPKWLAAIDYREQERRRSCRVVDEAGGRLRYEFSGAVLPTRTRPLDCHFFSYPVMDGRMMRAHMHLRLLAWGERRFRGGFTIAPGTLAELRPGRPLQYLYAARGQAILYEPRPVG